MTGQTPKRANITGITNADPCVVTIDANPGYETGSFVRLTDLNGAKIVSPPAPRGMDPINNGRFKINLITNTTFSLKDPITEEYIDSTNYPPYISGGYCNLVNHEFIYNGE